MACYSFVGDQLSKMHTEKKRYQQAAELLAAFTDLSQEDPSAPKLSKMNRMLNDPRQLAKVCCCIKVSISIFILIRHQNPFYN